MALMRDTAEFDLDVAATPLLRWRQLVRVAPLALALIGATVMYWPALTSGFVADDYIYLNAAKSLSMAHYARVSLVPNSHDAVLTFTSDFWRPLFFMSFKAMQPAFGDHVVYYHLINLAIHFTGIGLIWTLARRLTGRWEAAGISAVVFAVHPAGFDSVSWVSSVNSAALPLGIGAWLALISAVEREPGRTDWRWIAASVGLVALALGFRETAVVFLGGMMLWYGLVFARPKLREPRSYIVVAPYAVLVVAYYLVRTRFLTEPAANAAAYHFGSQVPDQAWYYLKLGLFPFKDSSVGWHLALERLGAGLILAGIPVALIFRRWLLAVMLIGVVGAVVPYSALTLGVTARYFYFPSAFLALALGVLSADGIDAAHKVASPRLVGAAGAACVVVILGVGTYVGQSRVDDWVAREPDVHQTWVDQLHAKFPTLPAGGTLYTTNTPLLLALFDNLVLGPTVSYYYPQVGKTVRFDPGDFLSVEAKLGPNDRVFVYDAPK